MTQTLPNPLTELKALETKIDTLIGQFDTVRNENRLLKTKQEELIEEKARLLEKTALARTRVEAMISRLKAMEQDI
ncbi:TIGR02449 family protein [Methylocucumis oryzae]|uniref:TIGR02449 family protein n=1 Tax=Methylocucumis oryzae TaxID=1632867 RepID=A0A0F3IQS8_9GAMM|nr:TIGR02449 family protein [Methylocucumis oryzae]KJV07959.1 hypothetical protein VZ94_01235 [Methylocucumis oryzae]